VNPSSFEVLVVGAGPAGVLAALRAADLGAKTALVTRDAFGGMAANDGPVPVRTLAHAARLMREARQLGQYGISTSDPVLDYPKLLSRVGEVVDEVRRSSALREQLGAAGVTILEHAGTARFRAPHAIETASGLQLRADTIILCTGGTSRRLPIPGFELTATHSDAWSLTSVPPSMVVVGGGATGVQVASVFNAFGSRVQLFEAGARLLSHEDEAVSHAVTEAFRASGIDVREGFGTIEGFSKVPDGIRMHVVRDGEASSVDASLVVMAVGWQADTAALNLAGPGIETNARGFVRVDEFLRTSVPHVLAAGDVTGGLMLVPQALQAGFVAATNAVRGDSLNVADVVSPIGSFTEPEYAQVGLTEARARAKHEIVTAVAPYPALTRSIIDGRTNGFCKIVVDRTSHEMLGCHVVGERAVDIVQVAAVAMAGRMRIGELARVPLSFPTYAGILGRAAASAARQLNVGSRPSRIEAEPSWQI